MTVLCAAVSYHTTDKDILWYPFVVKALLTLRMTLRFWSRAL
jgi:hypothetical protein